MKKETRCLILVCLVVFTSCWNRYTGSTDDGDGHIFYLDRHDLYCNDGEAMTEFQLYRPSSDKIRYRFTCVANSSIDWRKSYNDYTSWNDVSSDRNQSTNYLDRHSVNCNDDHAMVGFKLERSGDRIRYAYKCAPIKGRGCDDKLTSWTDGDVGRTYYLDRQHIWAPSGAFLRGFRLQTTYYDRGWLRDTGMNFRFNVRYCFFRDVDSEKAAYKNDKWNYKPRGLEYKEDSENSH